MEVYDFDSTKWMYWIANSKLQDFKKELKDTPNKISFDLLREDEKFLDSWLENGSKLVLDEEVIKHWLCEEEKLNLTGFKIAAGIIELHGLFDSAEIPLTFMYIACIAIAGKAPYEIVNWDKYVFPPEFEKIHKRLLDAEKNEKSDPFVLIDFYHAVSKM